MRSIICMFLPSLNGGGAERVMVMLANAFSERRFSVDLVLVKATGPYVSQVSSLVNIVDLNRSRVILSLPGLIEYLRKRKPAVLLSAMSHANLIALLSKKITNNDLHIVVSEHNNNLMEITNNNSFKSRIIGFLNSKLYRSADEIIGVSYGVSDATAISLKLPRDKIKTIYNPVVSDQLYFLAEKPISYTWIGDKSKRLIVATGRLTQQKDFATLIRAFAVIKKNINSRLVILGEGELRSNLIELIVELDLKDSVILPGFVDNPFAIFKKADLFVLSSAWEGLGNVLIEAMACGTPVVSTNCPSGPSEILENGKWGRLVPVGDVVALAKAMLDTLTETKHPDVASRAAYFSVERAADEYLKLLLPDLNQ